MKRVVDNSIWKGEKKKKKGIKAHEVRSGIIYMKAIKQQRTRSKDNL